MSAELFQIIFLWEEHEPSICSKYTFKASGRRAVRKKDTRVQNT